MTTEPGLPAEKIDGLETRYREFRDTLVHTDQNQIVEAVSQVSSTEQGVFLENLIWVVTISFAQEKPDVVEQLMHILKTVADALDSPWGRARYHYFRSAQEKDQGRLNAALSHLEQALPDSQEPMERLQVLEGLTQMSFYTGDLNKSERWAYELMELAQEHANPLALANGYFSLAYIAKEKNQPGVALDWFEKADQAANEAADGRMIAKIAAEEAILHAQAKQVESAKARYEIFKEGLRQGVFTESGNEQVRGESALAANMAVLAARGGDFDEARKFAEQALAGQSLLSPIEQVDNLHIAGTVAVINGNFKEAKRYLLAGWQLAQSQNYSKGQFLTGFELSTTYCLQGYYEPAHRMCRQAIDALERVRSRIGQELDRLGYIQNKMESYAWMIRLCLILNDLKPVPGYRRQALAYAERARSRAFIESLGPTVHLSPPSELPIELYQTEQNLLGKMQALSISTQSALMDASLQQVHRETFDQLDLLWQKIGSVAPEYASLRRGVSVNYADICTLLIV